MRIHDFYSKLTSVNNEGHLFEALRSLSRIEDPRDMLNTDPEAIMGDWPTWPPTAAHLAHTASVGA